MVPVPMTMRISNSDVLLRKYYPAFPIVAAGRVLAYVNPWDERTGAMCFVGEVRLAGVLGSVTARDASIHRAWWHLRGSRLGLVAQR